MEGPVKRITFLILLLSILRVHASYAQQGSDADSSTKTDAQKLNYYESQVKSKTVAVLYAYLLPSAGHAYAGNWSRGLNFALGELGGGLMILAGYHGAGFIVPDLNTLGWTGVFTLFVLRIWEIFDAAAEVGKYNEVLYARIMGKKPYTLHILPSTSGLQVQLTCNF